MNYRIFSKFATIKDSLKTLELSIPTTKVTIKKQYLSLAKKYHPDSTQSEESQKEKFVQINKAYQYLRQLQQEQINANKDKKIDNISYEQEQLLKKKQNIRMTKQERQRKKTYEYFDKRERRVRRQENIINDEYRNKPLYKSVPQLFVGLLFVAIIFGEWGYKSLLRENQQIKNRKKNNQVLQDNGNFQNVYKSFNMKKKLGQKKIQKEQHLLQ